jgi:lysophospholipase L1-like esterase
MPPSLCRRLAPRAGLAVAAIVTIAACSSDRGALSAPSFGVPEGSASTLSTGGEARDGNVASVAMVGDSITVGSETALRDGFADLGVDLRKIDGASGRRITVASDYANSGVDAATALAPDDPDVWVIALGTNDVPQYDGEEAYRNEIAALLTVLPPDAPVVWVDTYLADAASRSGDFNQALRDTLAFRGTASVADWATVAAGDGVLRDGIHPSDEGTQLFADVVMSAVEPWLE